MKLKRALKEKKKLVRQIERNCERFRKYNSHNILNTNIPYSAEEQYIEWLDFKQQLIDLKVKIFIANQGIYPLILGLAEHKDTVAKLKSLDTKNGIEIDAYNRRGDETPPSYKAFISLKDKDSLIEELESKIEATQEKIDNYNSVTEI